MPQKILITGASGLVGSALSEMLSKKHTIALLGRTKRKSSAPSFTWDVNNGKMDVDALEGVDTIVHLAGANVGERRWTTSRKKELLNSRIQSTKLLSDALKNNAHSVRNFISASAIGYYGFDSDAVFDEESPPGKDFLAQLTKQWEEEVDKVNSLGIRVVKIRIGIVLARGGGALVKILAPIKYGIGAPIGTGKQYLSWIHIDDLCGIFVKAIEDEALRGAYNATANWTTNEDTTNAIAKVMRKPLWLPNVPGFLLKLALGEMAQIVLHGSKVSSEKIAQAGYRFKYVDLEQALVDLVGQ